MPCRSHWRSRSPPATRVPRGTRSLASTATCLIVPSNSIRRLPSSGSSPASAACPSTRLRISSSPHTYTHAPDCPAAIHRACSFRIARSRVFDLRLARPRQRPDGGPERRRRDRDGAPALAGPAAREARPAKPDARATLEGPASRARGRSATPLPRRKPQGDATMSALVPAQAGRQVQRPRRPAASCVEERTLTARSRDPAEPLLPRQPGRI